MSNAVNSKNVAIFANGYDVSNYLRNFQAANSAPELDSTTFQDTARTFVPDFADGNLSLDGWYSVDLVNLNTAEEVFKTALGAASAQVITVCPEGLGTLGLRALLQSAVENQHNVASPAGGLITTAAQFRGPLNHGVLLAPKAARTTTGNLSSVDNGASSAYGGVAHLHVFAKAGTTPSITVKVQHSSDNSSFADLISFTAATDITSERVVLANTTTVNRYLRAQYTISGTTPSFTFALAFARFI